MRAEPAGNPAFETVIVSVEERVATITLHRPDALNALSSQVMTELVLAARALDADDSVAVIVLTGSGRAFAAGADIAEMQSKTFSEMHRLDWFSGWDDLARVRKPLVAAVAGFALGGGCELAMMCDIVLAADDARFGQPEVRLGIPPGIGATQRLTRAVGKSLAMELCLTGRMLDAHEALARGLVSRVVPREELLVAATDLARTIASYSISATTLIKDCVNQAFETGLTQGLHYERRSFHAAFATADQAEGMDAFLAKRSPTFTNSSPHRAVARGRAHACEPDAASRLREGRAGRSGHSPDVLATPRKIARRAPRWSEIRPLVSLGRFELNPTDRRLSRAHTIDDLREVARRRSPPHARGPSS